MNNVANILGIQLPSTKARDSVMARPPRRSLSHGALLLHQDSLQLVKNGKFLYDDEEDTVLTMMSSSDSSLSIDCGVTFAEPLVTEVHTRPCTTRQEKNALFYNEHDYLEFKRDYYYGTSRNTLVKFAETVVSHVWTVPPHDDPSEHFYTEQDLQQ